MECSAVLRNGRYSQYWPKILCGRLRFCGRAEQSAKEPVVRDLPVACSVFRVRTNRSEQPPGRSDGTPRSGGAPIILVIFNVSSPYRPCWHNCRLPVPDDRSPDSVRSIGLIASGVTSGSPPMSLSLLAGLIHYAGENSGPAAFLWAALTLPH